jgi:ABC-type Fe3+/spermidine/putrescine transport system ATPase subunit
MAVRVEAKGEIRLVRLAKRYGTSTVVEGLDLTIGGGEFFSILGPSGSGKTTTMMMIAGFVVPSSGQILIDGRDVAGLAPQRRGLGVVFQNYALFPHLTVEKNIAFPLEVRGVSRRETGRLVGEMMDLVDLAGFGARLPKQLSGGQQQRVALARALVFKPRVLLMDEPLGALDKRLRDHMRAEIRRLHRHLRVTVLYVTHDQDEALNMSDRIAIMNCGRIEQIDPPRLLYDTPRTQFVAQFLGDSNFLCGSAVVCDSGEIRCIGPVWNVSGIAAEPIPGGARAVAAVRPERIVLLDAPCATLNCVSGTVAEVNYAGDAISCTVTVSGERIRCKMPYRGELPRAGVKVVLGWRREDTRLFRSGPDVGA